MTPEQYAAFQRAPREDLERVYQKLNDMRNRAITSRDEWRANTLGKAMGTVNRELARRDRSKEAGQ